MTGGHPSLTGTCYKASPWGQASSSPPHQREHPERLRNSGEAKEHETRTLPAPARNVTNPRVLQVGGNILILPYGRFAMSCCAYFLGAAT